MNTQKSLLAIVIGKSGSIHAQLVHAVLGSFGLKVINTFLTMATAILLARILGAEGYGIYAFALAIITMLTVPTQFGLPNLVIRYVASYLVQNDLLSLRGILQFSNIVVLCLSFTVILISGFILWLLANHISKTFLYTFCWALCLLPLLALGTLRSSGLSGLHQVVLGRIPELLVRPGFLLILTGFAYLVLGQAIATPYWIMAINVIATAIAFFLGAWLLLRHLPASVTQSTSVYHIHTWLHSAISLLLVGGMGVVNSQTDIFILGLLRTAEEVGIYRVAVTGASLVAFSLLVVNPVLAPIISRLYTQGDMQRLQRIITNSARVITFSSLIIAIPLIFFGKQILEIVFGSQFSKGHYALAIMCIGQLVNAGMGSVAFLLTMTGHEGYTARGMIYATVVNLSLNFLLIPFFGIEGAAVANSTSLITRNILLGIWVRQKLQINSTAFEKL